MVRKKKAQAAMEFLMTYGWTILIVLLVVAALVYFDVLNPAKFLPNTCSLQGFNCEDFAATTSGISLYLINNIGDDLNITAVVIGEYSNTTSRYVRIGDPVSIVLTYQGTVGDGGELAAGDRLKESIKINYTTKTSGISHTNVGDIATIVEG